MNCVSHPAAELDLLQAAAYYEERTAGLGAEFFEEFQRALSLIRRHPEGAPAVRGELRRLVLSRFPYNVIYRVTSSAIRILAVAHQKRSPDYWIQRR